MEFEIQILSGGIFLGAGGIVLSIYSMLKQRRMTRVVDEASEQVKVLTDELLRIKESIEQNSQRLSEQKCRVAWLETKIRQPKHNNSEVQPHTAIQETPKETMTERRHRVVALASRGQNADMIAMALGMLRGEVELIMNLNRAAATRRNI
ncbi:MAG: DUF6115 domain-containing protein [Pyrinomonadaceae bacterium]